VSCLENVTILVRSTSLQKMRNSIVAATVSFISSQPNFTYFFRILHLFCSIFKYSWNLFRPEYSLNICCWALSNNQKNMKSHYRCKWYMSNVPLLFVFQPIIAIVETTLWRDWDVNIQIYILWNTYIHDVCDDHSEIQ